MDLGLELERIRLELADLRQYVESIPRVPATELGVLVDEDIPVAGDTVPEIVDQTGAAGTSEDYRRTDCVPKLKLAGGPADTGTYHGYPTAEFCAASAGLQAKIKANAGIEVVADGMAVAAAAPINVGASGVGINLGNGVQNSGGSLTGKAKTSGGITIDADGFSVNMTEIAHALLSATHSDTTAASVVRGDIITGQGAAPNTKWARLAIGTSGYVLTAWSTGEPAWAAFNQPGGAGLISLTSDWTCDGDTMGTDYVEIPLDNVLIGADGGEPFYVNENPGSGEDNFYGFEVTSDAAIVLCHLTIYNWVGGSSSSYPPDCVLRKLTWDTDHWDYEVIQYFGEYENVAANDGYGGEHAQLMTMVGPGYYDIAINGAAGVDFDVVGATTNTRLAVCGLL